MAVLEAALSILSFSSSSSSKPHLFSRQTKPTSLNIQIPSNLSPFFPLTLSTPLRAGCDNSRRLVSVCSSVTEEEASPLTEETQKENLKRKLFVFNLPWSMSVNDISQLFGQCGTVSSVEVLCFYFLNSYKVLFLLLKFETLLSDHKAKRWEEPRFRFRDNVFWRRSSIRC